MRKEEWMSTEKIQFFWHRGDHRCHRENSLSALQAALLLKPSRTELDIVMTADGYPLINHDWHLGIFGEPNRRIDELNWSEIKKEKVHPLLFFDLLESWPNEDWHEKLLIEIKKPSQNLSKQIYWRFLQQVKVFSAETWSFNSFDLPILESFYNWDKNLRLFLNVESQEVLDNVEEIFKNHTWLAGFIFDIELNFPKEVLDIPSIGFFTCNTKSHFEKAFYLGADLIISDRADLYAQ